jgi:hypothetical protein
MIYGNLQRYWRQNTKHEDYISMVQAFGNHLTNRDNDITTIITHLKDAANHITKKESKRSITEREAANDTTATHEDRQRLFLHAEFHPKGIPRRTIRQLYNRTLIKTQLFDEFIVAYHRPHNLRNLLSKTKMRNSPAVLTVGGIMRKRSQASPPQLD